MIFFIFIFNIVLSNPFLPKNVDKNNKGFNEYKNKNYDEALKHFSSIKGEDAISNFNSGASNYKKEKYDEALKNYDTALKPAGNRTKLNTLYNLGNTFFNLGKINESLSSYQAALDLCSQDSQAIGASYCKDITDKIRNNMQFVFNNKDKKKNKEQKKEDKDDKKDDKKDKQEKKDKNKKEQEDKDDKSKNSEKDKQESKKDDSQNKGGSQANSSAPTMKKNISEQQARQLLNIINESDKTLQKELLKSKGEKNKADDNSAKDW